MLADACGADDVHDLDVSHQQRVAYQRPMASPWYCLGAHNRRGFAFSQVYQFLYPLGELRCLHVVSVVAKRFVAPRLNGLNPKKGKLRDHWPRSCLVLRASREAELAWLHVLGLGVTVGTPTGYGATGFGRDSPVAVTLRLCCSVV